MAIGKDKSRMIITLDKEDHEKIKVLAKQENRSVSNYMQVLLKRHIEEIKNT